MEIWNHICFNIKSRSLTMQYILDNNIEHDMSDDICAFDISENDPRWIGLAPLVKAENLFCLSETKYSKEELYSSEWLTVRSRWYYDYPQPEDRYREITYTKEFLCLTDGCGIEPIQKDSFRFKRTPKWGRRNFCMTNWVYDELFVSPKAKELLEASDLQGFSFLPVKNKSGKEFLADVFQMQIPTILPEGISVETTCIREIYDCPVCGRKKFRPNGLGQYVYHRSCFENAPDFVKTAEWFGAAASAARLIIISQKAYRFIIENKLDSSLVFEVVRLI